MAAMRSDVFYARMKKAGSGEKRRKLLRTLMDEHGVTVAELARRAGFSPNTLYNFFNGRSDSLNQETLDKISAALGLTGDSLSGLAPALEAKKLHFIKVVGEVQAGVWREATELLYEDFDEIQVPIPDRYKSRAFGLITKGPSMNLLYPEGTIVVCVKLAEFDDAILSGDRVIVYRRQNDLIEATCKEVVEQDGRIWLWPRSDHPEHQAPLPLPNQTDDDLAHNDTDGIWIHAVVIGSYRPERAGRLR
ncbi:MAG TPA: helix-turn-helix domain-containing protein [Calditerricola sp.]